MAEALHASDNQRFRAEALEQYKLAVLTNPTDPKAATRLGSLSTVYRKLHRPEDVKRELDPDTKYKDRHEKLTSIYKNLDSANKTPGI